MPRILVLFALAATTLLSACTIGRMAVYGFSDIRDYRKFPKRPLEPSAEPFHFHQGDQTAFQRANVRVTYQKRHQQLDSLLDATKTVAFLVIRQDSILYEQYFDKYTATDVVPSFSMAKSFTSALVGCAVDEGLIRSIEDPITDYLPELKADSMEDVKIRHLLEMTTGIHHAENYYNPFAGVARLYYGKHLSRQITGLKQDYEAGHYYKYQSINTQILGELVVRVTGKSLSEYLQEKIWTPVGMENPASWSIDQKKNGREKAFCCINATAVDFAKFGRLYLREGDWDGQRLLSADWVRNSTRVNAADASVWYYQYQWWLPSKEGDYCAAGHLGQYIYVHPEKEIIIVRLGKKTTDLRWMAAFREIAAQL